MVATALLLSSPVLNSLEAGQRASTLELATVQALAPEEGLGSYGVWACLWDVLRALVSPAAALLSADKLLGFTHFGLIAFDIGKAIAFGHRAYI